jgi:hypothetical protein
MMYDVNHEEHKVSMIREEATDRAVRQFCLLIRRKGKARMALCWAPPYRVHRSYSVRVFQEASLRRV